MKHKPGDWFKCIKIVAGYLFEVGDIIQLDRKTDNPHHHRWECTVIESQNSMYPSLVGVGGEGPDLVLHDEFFHNRRSWLKMSENDKLIHKLQSGT